MNIIQSMEFLRDNNGTIRFVSPYFETEVAFAPTLQVMAGDQIAETDLIMPGHMKRKERYKMEGQWILDAICQMADRLEREIKEREYA